MENWMKQMSECNMQFQHNLIATIHDLKMQSVSSRNIPSQTISNSKGGGLGIVTLHSGRELPQQPAPQPNQKLAEAETKPGANSYVQKLARSVPLPFPTRIVTTRSCLGKVKINIPLLDAIKQVPKYAKFLKELYIYKTKKMKGAVKTGGIVSTLIKHEDASARKCQDPSIFSVSCTIINCTFVDAMLDLGASINVMPARMVIQLANRSVLEDFLVQVNNLIFLVYFYVLDIEDEVCRKGSALILGRPFLMRARAKVDMYAGTLSMEFRDNLVQFNTFEALKHPDESSN
ncbi:hypothetical protein CR513_54291, partial [Mucuna pruriens]